LPVKNDSAGAIGLVLFLLFITQYIWGKTCGKHKIIPKVSPNKTWEGFLGAVLTTSLVAGFIAPLLTPLEFKYGLLVGLLVGLVIAVSGFFGDVLISSVKRDLQIKDSGNLIPGHGGILDRLDSLIYTAPLFFHLVYYLKY
jgi:phosphatidate cytidylyltransferase